MLHSGRVTRTCLAHRMENHMTSLQELKRQLTMAKAERSMLIRRSQPTDGINARIAQIKAEIDAKGATVAEVNAAGRFTPEDQPVSEKQLFATDRAVMSDVHERGNWGMVYPWRR